MAEYGSASYGLAAYERPSSTRVYKVLGIVVRRAYPPHINGGLTLVEMDALSESQAVRHLENLRGTIDLYSGGMGHLDVDILMWDTAVTGTVYSESTTAGGNFIHPGLMRTEVGADPSYDFVFVVGDVDMTSNTIHGLAVYPHGCFYEASTRTGFEHEVSHWLEFYWDRVFAHPGPYPSCPTVSTTVGGSIHCFNIYGYRDGVNDKWYRGWFSGALGVNTNEGASAAAWAYPPPKSQAASRRQRFTAMIVM